jgi:subfamily B ATP-binding cassette protein HlyB/CyaB
MPQQVGVTDRGACLDPISPNDFVWALGSLCQLNRIPFDRSLLLSQLPPPYDWSSLVQAATALGFRCELSERSADTAESWAFPCVVFLRAEPAEDGAPKPGIGLALLVRADTERVLLFNPGANAPTTMSRGDFAARHAGQALFATPAAPSVEDPDAPRATRAFGFRWFVPELLKHRSTWRDVLIASLAIQLMALAVPLLTQVVIDKVVVHRTINTLVVVGVAMALFMIFSAIMSWVRQYLILHTGNRIDAVLATRVFDHLLKLPLRYYETRPTGVIVARVNGVEQIREFLASAAVTLLLDCPFLFVFLAIMFYYSAPLTLVSLAILAVIVGLSLLVAPLLRARLNVQFLLGARNQAFLTEYVAGMETLKSLQLEPQLNARFGQYLGAYMEAGFRTKQLGNTYSSAANLLEQIMTLAILAYGASIVMNNPEFTIGMLVAFQMFAGRLSQPLLRLVGLWQQFQQANISVKRLGDLMNAPTEPYSVVPRRESGGPGALEVRGLAFRYDEHLPYLYRDLDLKLQPGQCVAVMGPSGCGKSTLTKLMQGFYLPEDGQILIDGRDIRYLSANELRRHFGVVPQETLLFSGTVLDNLMMANPHASFEQVVQACKMAEIHEFIDRLPKGYQTELGERGVGLSGGQRQRVAIARALLKRPQVLIFDEAVSSLDGATAEQIARTVNALKGRMSILFITHQLPRSLKVDAIFEIGRVPPEEKRFGIIQGGAPEGTPQGARE